MAYLHTQSGRPVWISFTLLALGFGVMAAIDRGFGPTPRMVLVGGAAFALVLAVLWGRLTVRVDQRELAWYFGPGWPRFSVPLAAIARAEVTRTPFWQGWGIHRPRDGWLYNIGGYDALRIDRVDGTRFLLGTDEPHKLKRAIERAMTGGGAATRDA